MSGEFSLLYYSEPPESELETLASQNDNVHSPSQLQSKKQINVRRKIERLTEKSDSTVFDDFDYDLED
jgi:hypothetical protein